MDDDAVELLVEMAAPGGDAQDGEQGGAQHMGSSIFSMTGALLAGVARIPARDRAAPSSPDREVGREAPQRKAPEPEPPTKTRVREMDPSL